MIISLSCLATANYAETAGMPMLAWTMLAWR
jgi:hypothetical protein